MISVGMRCWHMYIYRCIYVHVCEGMPMHTCACMCRRISDVLLNCFLLHFLKCLLLDLELEWQQTQHSCRYSQCTEVIKEMCLILPEHLCGHWHHWSRFSCLYTEPSLQHLDTGLVDYLLVETNRNIIGLSKGHGRLQGDVVVPSFLSKKKPGSLSS